MSRLHIFSLCSIENMLYYIEKRLRIDNPWWGALSYAKYNLQDEAEEVLERELKKLKVDTEEVLENASSSQVDMERELLVESV